MMEMHQRPSVRSASCSDCVDCIFHCSDYARTISTTLLGGICAETSFYKTTPAFMARTSTILKEYQWNSFGFDILLVEADGVARSKSLGKDKSSENWLL